MKALLVIIMNLCLHVTYAQKPDTTKTFIQGKELGEVVVKSSYLTREGDYLLAIPTKEQRKHAVTGYDLLSNLMIPGVSVERSTGSVTTPNGAATLYIDGREVDFREVQSLRPKDVSRVEYFDVPNGKYAKDAYAINIIMKPLNNGGYTQLDASQNVGYLHGDYNLISKFVTGTKSLNLWAGYSLENPKSSMDENETFIFPDYQLNRLQHYNNADNRQTEEYVQASISNRGKKYIWMLRGGMAWNASKNGVNNGMTEYWKTAAAIKNGSILDINTRNKSYRPSVYFYGLHTFSNTKSLDYVFDGYYSRNDYDRLYDDDNVSFRSLVKEDYYYIKANANYSINSWGISKMYATQIVKNVNGEDFTMAALVMQVNGFQFQGEVYIALDEGSDYYRIYGEKDGTTKEYHHDIAFDELGDVLDSMIETGGMTKEEYQAKVKDFVCSL